MRISSPSSDRVLSIYLALNQYPILKQRIRARMRRALFQWGVIRPDQFEVEVRKRAIESQTREGLNDPYAEESFETWELRLFRVRESLTDFYFAHNFLYEDFEMIVKEIVGERGSVPDIITFNPELAPQDMLFEQAELIENQSSQMPDQNQGLMARLQEIKAVLIRTMISDQLTYLNIARKWFTISDLKEIKQRTIGYGKIGGKSAGMILAYRILSEAAPPEIKAAIRLPVSYFLASDMFYTFMATNELMHWADQKYKNEAQIRAEFETIKADFVKGTFPDDIVDKLKEILAEAGKQPLIVRSSSLLEDNLGMSFAGKYDSFFCPNQGTPEENLKALVEGIALVYASCFNPDAILYRNHKGLIEYDERIAVLIQHVQGERYGDFFMPQASGVGFSRNLYRWSPQIKREDGFLRLVWGLGTRAVEQLGDDYPRLVALSHPLLHPAAETKMLRRYSQHYVDVIDLKANLVTTLPAEKMLNPRYPPTRYIAQVDQGDYLAAMRTSMVNPEDMVITFDEMLRRTSFAGYMRTILKTLETHFRGPVDMEFTVEVADPHAAHPDVRLSILQCRHQSAMNEEGAQIPESLADEDIIFTTRRMVPHGAVLGIPYVVYVSPEEYFSLKSQALRTKLERAIGALNAALKGEVFICVGPGRWGTSTPDLGVHVGYGDIYSTYALVELSGKEIGTDPEPSFGTHFFQDLMEARIFPLAVNLDDLGTVFNRSFFNSTPNHLLEKIPCNEKAIQNCLRLIYTDDFKPGYLLSLIMDDDQGKAVAFMERKK